MKRLLLLGALPLALAGCAAGPDYVRPALGPEIPTDWTRAAAVTAAEPEGRWWEAFGDPALNDLVALALAHNLDLAAAAGRVAEARALAGGAESARWPAIEIGGTAQRSKQANLNFPSFIDPHLTSFSATATARWEADLWGRLSRAREAEVAGLLAGENDRRALAQSLVAEVVRLWLQIDELDRQLDLTRRSVTSYAKTLQTVEDRYLGGLVTALDMHLARQNLAVAQANEPAQLQARAAARRRLEILCGNYPAGTVTAGPVSGSELPPVPGGLPSSLLERRPDLAAAELRLHGAVARIGQAKAALYPRISLTGTAGAAARELADLGKQGSDVWSLVGNLVMPLINRGATTAQAEAAEARAAQAAAAYRQAVLTAFAEVENALDQDHLQGERAAHLEEAARSARLAEEISRDRYQRGLDGILVLLEAQRRLYSTESQRLAAGRERRTARVNLILALGGPWDLPHAPAPAGPSYTSLNQGVQP